MHTWHPILFKPGFEVVLLLFTRFNLSSFPTKSRSLTAASSSSKEIPTVISSLIFYTFLYLSFFLLIIYSSHVSLSLSFFPDSLSPQCTIYTYKWKKNLKNLFCKKQNLSLSPQCTIDTYKWKRIEKSVLQSKISCRPIITT